MSPTQVNLQASYFGDSALAVHHEFQPQVDLHKKWEPEQIKVKLPDGTNFQMAAFGNGNNKEYLVHVIAALRII